MRHYCRRGIPGTKHVRPLKVLRYGQRFGFNSVITYGSLVGDRGAVLVANRLMNGYWYTHTSEMLTKYYRDEIAVGLWPVSAGAESIIDEELKGGSK